MRAAALLLALALPASGGEITFAGPEGVRTEADPRAPLLALRTERQTFGAAIAPGVGLFVEPVAGATIHGSNLLAGAVVRRLSGHAEASRVLSSGRLFTLRARLSGGRGRAVLDWALTDERGAAAGAGYAVSRLSGAGRIGPEEAERLAFQIAAQLQDETALGPVIAAAAALARIEGAPSPAPRPEPEAEPET
ncbi:MAG: hypothetical protein ACE37J_07720 [Pikeienuella sp.]|uniref:hypothetical protein n=1 Tax=Pikeienuella sp. TaxID=2831957 RepID=UPI00391C5246